MKENTKQQNTFQMSLARTKTATSTLVLFFEKIHHLIATTLKLQPGNPIMQALLHEVLQHGVGRWVHEGQMKSLL